MLEGVQLTPRGDIVDQPPLDVAIPGDFSPDELALATLDGDRLVAAWCEGARLLASVVSEAAAAPILISESASGAVELLATETGGVDLLFVENARTLWTSVDVHGESVEINLKPSVFETEPRLAADAPSFAVAAWRDRFALAWADADGGVHAQWLGGSGRRHAVRAADGAKISDLQLAIGADSAWVSWLESRNGEGVRVVKGLPEIFADGFETGDTSAWDFTLPPVNLSVVSPSEGEAVPRAAPTIAVRYDTPTGVGVDPATLSVTRDGAPVNMACDALPTSATCVPVTPFADGAVTLEVTVLDLVGRSSRPSSVTFEVDTAAPVLDLTAPLDGLVTSASEVPFAGQVSEPVDLRVNGADVSIDGATLGFDGTVALKLEGPQDFTWTATDAAGNVTEVARTVSRDTVAPAVIDLSTLAVEVTAGQVQINGAATAVESGARVHITNTRSGETVEVVADSVGAFAASIVGDTRDVLAFEVIDSAGNTSEIVSIPAPFDLPPDPADVAPPLDRTVA
ncbi:MAG: hypothetical protein AAGF23_17185, partial [Acidobacteriota bacterium]